MEAKVVGPATAEVAEGLVAMGSAAARAWAVGLVAAAGLAKEAAASVAAAGSETAVDSAAARR